MEEVFEFGYAAYFMFIGFFSPLSSMAIFMALTANMAREKIKIVAYKSVIVAVIITLFFGFLGRFILDKLEITEHSLKIAGGFFIFLMGLNIMQGRGGQREDKNFSINQESDIAISPIGIPLLCGPAMIVTSMIKMAEAKASAAPTLMSTSSTPEPHTFVIRTS